MLFFTPLSVHSIKSLKLFEICYQHVLMVEGPGDPVQLNGLKAQLLLLPERAMEFSAFFPPNVCPSHNHMHGHVCC